MRWRMPFVALGYASAGATRLLRLPEVPEGAASAAEVAKALAELRRERTPG